MLIVLLRFMHWPVCADVLYLWAWTSLLHVGTALLSLGRRGFELGFQGQWRIYANICILLSLFIIKGHEFSRQLTWVKLHLLRIEKVKANWPWGQRPWPQRIKSNLWAERSQISDEQCCSASSVDRARQSWSILLSNFHFIQLYNLLKV